MERVPELWTEVRNTIQEAVTKTIPKKKKSKKAKWLSQEALQIAEERRKVKGRKGKMHTQLSTKRHIHPNVHSSTIYNS